MDTGLEFALYQLLRSELPDCIVVSVSHRPAPRAAARKPARTTRWRPMAAGPSRGGARRSVSRDELPKSAWPLP
ncbi:ABC transporter subunit [Mycobacterium tuberculosis variant africanum K85]|uniref:ABC transporter subunit n=1 Tax=Mycobacterium tuberculosis variant africanum K85 TaxID=611304 RepID=A0A9P2H896_MYCTX|nr:ABC transporter subunit [Mycobacterium tuberculosis variant africanum K85]